MNNNDLALNNENNAALIELLNSIEVKNASLMQQIQFNNQATFKLAQAVNNQATVLQSVVDRIDKIENSVMIDSRQATNIRNAVSRRVFHLIGENPISRSIATRLFHQRCYCDAARYAGLGRPYRDTPRRNYDSAMAYIESWTPKGGVSSLLDEAMKNHKISRMIK